MRYVWAGIVMLILGIVSADALLSATGAKSAVQLSQVYDGVSATALVLIGITLAFWYAASKPRGE